MMRYETGGGRRTVRSREGPNLKERVRCFGEERIMRERRKKKGSRRGIPGRVASVLQENSIFSSATITFAGLR
jgi:hypothetical protein